MVIGKGNTHTMEYKSTIKRNEMLKYVKIWMNLKNIMLKDIVYKRLRIEWLYMKYQES